LLHRIAVLNVVLVLTTFGVTVALLPPSNVASYALYAEIAVLLVSVTLVVAANVFASRRLVGPMRQ
jgi:hypothetical protein